MPVAEECEAKPDFNERYESQKGVYEKCRQLNSQVSLELPGVVLVETAVAEELARSCREENRNHHDSNDSFRVFQR